MIGYQDISYEGAPYREQWNQQVVRGGDGRTRRPPSNHRYVEVSRQYAPWGEHRLQGLGVTQTATPSLLKMTAKVAPTATTPYVGESPGFISGLPWWTWVAVPMILGGAALFAYDQGWIGGKQAP